jgi:predicted secreted Zn-dependent protease
MRDSTVPTMPAPITAADLEQAIETILTIAAIPSMAEEGLVGFMAGGLQRGRWYPYEDAGKNDCPPAGVFVDIEEIMALPPSDRVGCLRQSVVAARAFWEMLMADPREHEEDRAEWQRRRRALDFEEDRD